MPLKPIFNVLLYNLSKDLIKNILILTFPTYFFVYDKATDLLYMTIWVNDWWILVLIILSITFKYLYLGLCLVFIKSNIRPIFRW